MSEFKVHVIPIFCNVVCLKKSWSTSAAVCAIPRFVPEKSNDVARIVKMFEGEEAKLFEALEAKYGARPDFDVAMLHYDFSSHKQYAWDDKEVLLLTAA